MSSKRLLASAVALLGLAGVIGCAAGIASALWVGGRLNRANDRSFAAVQKSLSAAHDLVVRSRDRARELAAEDLGGALRDAAKQQISREVVVRVSERSQRVSQRLEQA